MDTGSAADAVVAAEAISIVNFVAIDAAAEENIGTKVLKERG